MKEKYYEVWFYHYKDNVHNFFIEHWNELSDDMKQKAHLELSVNIDYGELKKNN